MALYRHLGDPERNPAPEEWLLASLAEDWGALPYPGALVEQPYRLLIIGSRMREFARAYAVASDQGTNAPDWARKAVAHVQALSALERMA